MSKKCTSKRFLVGGLLITAVFIFSGCGNSEINGRAFNRPDFGQPEEEADIKGIIDSISGNELTILQIDRGFDRGYEGDEEQIESAEAFGTGMSGGAGTGRGMGGDRPEMDEDMQDEMIERMKEMSTGSVTVVVPVGIQMLASVGEEASLADLKINNMIQVWLDDVSGQASFVLIMN